MKYYLLSAIAIIFIGCSGEKEEAQSEVKISPVQRKILSLEDAQSLIKLPLNCVGQEYPNKLNQVIDSDEDLKAPEVLHPAFYGCFDWHSAVHGHWSLVRLAKSYPELNENDTLINLLLGHISKENISKEIEYFKDGTNQGYERMYGWAWLLKLADEIHTWDHPRARELEENLSPLSKLIAENTIKFLPKLNYAIRVGTHTNTAFALSMAYDYADNAEDDSLKASIEKRAREYYIDDMDCPLSWEPSGYDFLSPCLEEADLMRRVLSKDEFKDWLNKFLPQLTKKNFELEPGKVSDREDGHLVHLDGLNFSRAWCLYGIAETLPEYDHLIEIANAHIEFSLSNLRGDSYEGGHWLASFALLSLSVHQE